MANLARRMAMGCIGLAGFTFCLILVLRWVPVPFSAFMVGHFWSGDKVEYDWVPLAQISRAMPIAVVAAEDQRFPDHWGFDFEAIADAMEHNNKHKRLRGASTISQQVAKNLFLWPGRSWLRKGLEAGFTVAIELCWPKRRILEVYLNIAQFGPNIFGVGAASKRYFNRSPAKITSYQAALLAAALPNPKAYKVAPPSSYVWQRAADIQEQVRLLGGPAYLTRLDR
ncbi:MAG: monofunctional biosynthetic peptidoglycan transglycosylase [Desulfobacterales bacterium]|nr:monofunctional biosynthetic peptidoglycan transglycosylase [Desulfobacterales bacterium]